MTDWEKLQSKVGVIAEEAAQRTDSRLTRELADVTGLSQDDVQRYFPEPADAETLRELMEIVRSSTDRNEKINTIVKNAEQFAGVIVTLLGKLA